MLPTLFKQPSQSNETSESDSWYVRTGIQETYDTVLKESDEWEEIVRARPKGRFSSLSSVLSRKKSAVFVVEHAVSPRLYRISDEEHGEISFELIEVEDGGTSVKSTYGPRARALVQNFKAKMPIKIPSSTGQKVCPSCGKEMLPEFSSCPYCGTKLK